MKNKLLYLILSLLVCTTVWAQDEVVEPVKESPVSDAWSGTMIIDNQTSFIPSAKTLEFMIQHKFGTIQNGHSDLWGVYNAAADVRLGLNYVPIEDLQIGLGISKVNMNTDFSAKWNVLKQTQRAIPVSVTLYGNMAIDGRDKDDVDETMEFFDRFNYFSEVIVGRKFNNWLSLQGGVSFSHANLVKEGYDHDRVGLHFNGRAKVTTQGSIICTFDAPLRIDRLSEQPSYQETKHHPEPTLSFGYEISTFTHIFSVYVGNSASILQQQTMLNNYNAIKKDNFAIGFTITRFWMF